MGSANNNTGKNREARSKLEQEIYNALNSEPEFEELLDPELSPLNEPVEEIPAIKRKAYFKELCNWLSNGYQQLFHKTYAKRDYLIRYATFPPEQVPEPGDVQKQTWKPISEAALRLKPEPARKRMFTQYYQHHVFLTSMLEAINSDTAKFIETYASQTGKSLELKYAGGIQKCLELLISELRNYLDRKNNQLIPVLYHHRDHGLMMSIDRDDMPHDDEDEPVFEFGFSKTTSDNFVKLLVKNLEERLSSLDTSLMDKKTSHLNSGKELYDNKKLIDINTDIIPGLLELLKPYFDEEYHEDLEKLLNGEKITGKLLFKSDGIKMVDVFLRLKENKPEKILNKKVVIKNWICDHFQYLKDNGEISPYKIEYVNKILSFEKIISKDNQISLESISLS